MRRAIPALALILALLNAAISPARPEERQLPLARPLTLVDADGKSVTTGDFPGRFLLLYFGYTHCADQCPTALSAIVEALDEIGPAAAHIQPLFVTVDPERDKGPVLRDFTAAFDKRIIGLTGSAAQIAAAAQALGVDYQKVIGGSDDYVIDHSTTLSVIGPDRRSAMTFAMAEPYQIAATLLDLLSKGGVALGDVNNRRAYR